MFIFSLLKSNERPGLKRIEEQLMGNICRCTGYRPIMDAMKSFAGETLPDIEDLDGWVKVCPRSIPREEEQEVCRVMMIEEKTWVTPTNLRSLMDYLKNIPDSVEYKLVSGNTGRAVYEDSPNLTTLIDISRVGELKTVSSSPLKVGSAISISEALTHFESILETEPFRYKYLKTVTDNLVFLASPAIRDVASLAGNLMIKHQHPNFPSDIFTMFDALGAKITIANKLSGGEVQTTEYALSDWMKSDMKKKVVLHLTLPHLQDTNSKFQFFKVSPRSSFAYAHVNGAFSVEVDEQNKSVIKKASFVFGGVAGNFIHPTDVETFIVGKDLMNPNVMNQLFELLEREVVPDDDPHLTSGQYRTGLVSSLLYKFLLWCFQGAVHETKEIWQ